MHNVCQSQCFISDLVFATFPFEIISKFILCLGAHRPRPDSFLLYNQSTHIQQHLAILVPLQVLVLTHEMADLKGSDSFSHLAEMFSPVLPVVMYGRTAQLGTQVKKEETVWYGWRDLRA